MSDKSRASRGGGAETEPPARLATAPRSACGVPTGVEPSLENRDLLYVHSRSEHEGRYHVVRHRRDRFEVGEIRELEEGKPIVGEVVRLHPVSDHRQLYDVEPLIDTDPSAANRAGSGPSQVATARYRSNWEDIFGRRRKRGDGAPN